MACFKAAEATTSTRITDVHIHHPTMNKAVQIEYFTVEAGAPLHGPATDCNSGKV